MPLSVDEVLEKASRQRSRRTGALSAFLPVASSVVPSSRVHFNFLLLHESYPQS